MKKYSNTICTISLLLNLASILSYLLVHLRASIALIGLVISFAMVIAIRVKDNKSDFAKALFYAYIAEIIVLLIMLWFVMSCLRACKGMGSLG